MCYAGVRSGFTYKSTCFRCALRSAESASESAKDKEWGIFGSASIPQDLPPPAFAHLCEPPKDLQQQRCPTRILRLRLFALKAAATVAICVFSCLLCSDEPAAPLEMEIFHRFFHIRNLPSTAVERFQLHFFIPNFCSEFLGNESGEREEG